MSEESIDNWVELLRQQNYAFKDGKRLYGISHFVNDCYNSQVQWEDTRPSWVRESDALAAEFGLAPTWNTGAIKLPLYAAPFPLTYTGEQAATHSIRTFKEQQVLIQGTHLKRPRARVIHKGVPLASAVLEAIGLGWLTPTAPLPRLTIAQFSEWRRRHKQEQVQIPLF